MVNSRLITDLEPPAALVCQAQLAALAAKGIEAIVTSTYRDFEAQDALFAIGRTTDLAKYVVTNAKGGESWHNFRCAWDLVPLVGGKCVWKAGDPVWGEVIAAGVAAGAEAGALWKTLKDQPHFQVLPLGFDGKSIDLVEANKRWKASGGIWLTPR